MVSIKDVGQSSVNVPEFDKHLKKAGGHIGRNVVEITIKMKTTVRRTLMIKNPTGFLKILRYNNRLDPTVCKNTREAKQKYSICKESNQFAKQYDLIVK